MQSQILIAKPVQDLTNEFIALGIIVPLEFPFNLFVNLNQLINPDINLVYFFIYSFGRRKIAMWGVYNKYNQSFLIDGACRYQVNELANMLKEWKVNDFIYTGNSVRDRPHEMINKYLNKERMTYSEYLQNKFILGYFDNLITEEELNSRYPGILNQIYTNLWKQYDILPDDPVFQDILQTYLNDLRGLSQNYENTINRTDLNNDLLSKITNNIKYSLLNIVNRFYDNIKNGQFLSDTYYTSLNQCPSIMQCTQMYDEGCSVYYYGNIELGYLNQNDIRLLR